MKVKMKKVQASAGKASNWSEIPKSLIQKSKMIKIPDFVL